MFSSLVNLCVQQTFRFMTRLFSERCVLSDLRARRSGRVESCQRGLCDLNSSLHGHVYGSLRWWICIPIILCNTSRHHSPLPEPALPCSVLFIFSTDGRFHTCQGSDVCTRLFFFSLPSLSIVGSLCEFQMLLTCLSAGKSVHLGCYYRVPVCDWSTKETFHCLLLDYKHVLIHP